MMQEELLSQYVESLKGKIARIETLLTKFTEGNSKAGDNIRLLAHTLHGSGASFGFPEISEAGKIVEFADKNELAEKLLALKNVLEKVIADCADKIPAPSLKKAPEQQPSKKTQGEERKPEGVLNPVSKPKNKVLKILIVDDDEEIAKSLRNILTDLPGKQQFKLVASGAKAQEAIVSDVFDLIVMDLLLPDIDGRELIEQFKLEFQIKTPLLVVSTLQNDSVRVECMALGADKYLTKPFYEDVVLAETKKLLVQKVKKKLTLVPLDGEAVVEEEKEDEAEIRSTYLAGKNILIAEDDKMQAALIKQRLMEEGANVEHAGNGREAMQCLRSREYALLILDVNMPVMDGFEVLERIREELNLAMPVIMVTAMGSEEDIVRGYDLGATDYILKPFSEVQLFARVKSLLRGRKRGSKN